MDYRCRPRHCFARHHYSGSTIVESVVGIAILGVLAAFAIPQFIILNTKSRIVAVNVLAGSLESTAHLVHSLCMTSAAVSGCNVYAGSWAGTISGKSYRLSVGWPDAGDNLNGSEIDAMLYYGGFQAELPDWADTKFIRTDAPIPESCSVNYARASSFGPTVYTVTVTTSGC